MEDNQNEPITIEELMELPLKEVLENYSAVMSLECGYYYGILLADRKSVV